MISSISDFVSNAKNYASIIEKNLDKLDEFAARYNIVLDTSNWTQNMYDELDKFITDFTQNLSHALDTVMSVGGVVANIFVGVILAVYFLAGKRRLFEGVAKFRHSLLTDDQYKKHTAFLRRSSDIFSKYISYTLLEALGVGITNAVFMLIAGLPNVTLISVVVGVTNILPTFGPIIGCIVGAFLLFLEEPFYALLFIIFTLILQTIDGYIVKPKMFGDTLGIPSVVSLIAIIIGGKLFGPIDILLSIPFTAVLAILYHESFLPWLEKKKRSNESAKNRAENKEKSNA
jgi:predicted PurR-regulated permease PerM